MSECGGVRCVFLDVHTLPSSLPWNLQKSQMKDVCPTSVLLLTRTRVSPLTRASNAGPWLFAQLCLMLRTSENSESVLALKRPAEHSIHYIDSCVSCSVRVSDLKHSHESVLTAFFNLRC